MNCFKCGKNCKCKKGNTGLPSELPLLLKFSGRIRVQETPLAGFLADTNIRQIAFVGEPINEAKYPIPRQLFLNTLSATLFIATGINETVTIQVFKNNIAIPGFLLNFNNEGGGIPKRVIVTDQIFDFPNELNLGVLTNGLQVDQVLDITAMISGHF